MPTIPDPVPAQLAARLRRAVLDHARSERRRVFAPSVHVGDPGGDRASFTTPVATAALDHAIRCDVVHALLRRNRGAGAPLIWLTRPGQLAVEDADLAWLAAAGTACGETRTPLTMIVVTRHGWRDPRSGTSRTWARIREHS